MRENIKVKDSVSPKDYLKVHNGTTSICIVVRSDAFEAKSDNVKASVVLRKGEVAKLHRYLGKVLDQMEEVD